MGTDAHVRDDT